MNILDEIVEVKLEEVKKLRRDFTISRFHDSQFFNVTPLSFANALKKDDEIALIAEIKKASPSKGIIREDFNHIRIASEYFEEEVNAVSVLTDEKFFMGSLKYLREIAEFKNSPLLRKDFIIDEYQVFEAKSNGADAILLIAAILSPAQIKELSCCALELGIETLLEIHSADEIDKIDFSANRIIGINNRDLKTFKTDLSVTRSISGMLPKEIIKVSESGIKEKEDFEFLKECNVDAVLIGESIMTSGNIKDKVKRIKEWSRRES